MEHAPHYGPSSAHRWLLCPASIWHQNDDRDPGKDALEGSAKHYVAEQLLKYNADQLDFVGELIDVDGTEVEFTRSMADNVSVYAQYAQSLIDEYPDATVHIEKRVSMEWFKPEYGGVFGTADLIIDEKFNELVVIDYKSGVGISVAPTSPQIKLYALMAAGNLLHTYERIRCIIIQPEDKYGEVVKEAVFEPDELYDWFNGEVVTAISDSLSEDPTFNPSDTACRWCDYAGECVAQARMALALADEDFATIGDTVAAVDPDSIDADRISYILKNAMFIKKWIEQVENAALNRMMQGELIPDFKLVEKHTKIAWNRNYDIEKELYEVVKLRKKDILTTRVRTPNQILELAPKIKHSLIKQLTVKPEGALTVAPMTDNRPEVSTIERAAKDFSMFE